ncbi:MAG: amino acid permease [Oscillibacter sp.]|nr:amino acid permease [Oscillibacter sp.]
MKKDHTTGTGFANTFTILALWALAFGCVIGWGSFVMPGTTFLPEAGPAGTAVGVAAAGAMVLVVGINYGFLAKQFPSLTPYAYTKRILGDDHAFLSAWSLALAYLSLLWANATAFILIGRYLLGDVLQWGFHYQVAGYDVWLGEIVTTLALQMLFGLLSGFAKRAATILRTAAAVVHFVSVVGLFIVVLSRFGTAHMFTPAFSSGPPEGIQVLNIAILAPWMFVGFEAVFDENRETRLSVRTVSAAALTAIVCGMTAYTMLALIGAACSPEAYSGWPEYAADLKNLSGVEGMPVLYALRAALGGHGLSLAGVAIFSTLTSSVLGFYHTAARVIRTMAADGLLPKKLAEETDGVPRNAILTIIVLSLPIPFLGRTAVGWNADVSTLSVAIVYAYISICAVRTAGERIMPRILGWVGVVCSVMVFFFLLAPNLFADNALTVESYLLLAAWSLLGIGFYWVVLLRDREHRFGKTTIMWLLMLFLLFYSANVWLRLSAQEMLAGQAGVDAAAAETVMKRNSLILMVLIAIALGVMFGLFSVMLKRERELDIQIVQSEERNRAKTVFLSNMSHDIRTPMNAIIGFTELTIRLPESQGKVGEYLEKIQASSNHLLSLINDVLEMSRIESGKIELAEEPVSLPEVLHDLNTIIIGQVEDKGQQLSMDALNVVNEEVYCDRLRLNQVLLNLLSNAVKYTPAGGTISVRLSQNGEAAGGAASYELQVKDNGIGMTPEFAERVFEAFEREKSSTVNGIQGTGLGMAITKRIVDLMGGTITVDTAPGQGTTFTVRVNLRIQNTAKKRQSAAELAGIHVLLADDDFSVCDSVTRMLSEMGMRPEWTLSGREAVLHARHAKERGDGFGLFLLDWRMPDLSGLEAARQIREAVGDAPPILLSTTYDWPSIQDDALAAGVTGFCNKPLFYSELYAALTKAVGSAKAEEAVPKKKSLEESFAGRRLLLVDDIEVNREIACAVLEMSGFEVEEACDGTEAVDKVAASAPGHYDAVLMDIQMPGMNGYDAARAIRSLENPELAAVPIIAMTANAFDEDVKAARDAGMDGHVAKPIDIAVLLTVLGTVLAPKEDEIGTYVI